MRPAHVRDMPPGGTPALTPLRNKLNPSVSELIVLIFPSYSRGPNKALSGFLFWALINFYWLGKDKNCGQ